VIYCIKKRKKKISKNNSAQISEISIIDFEEVKIKSRNVTFNEKNIDENKLEKQVQSYNQPTIPVFSGNPI